MAPGSLVRFESTCTRGRYFVGRVVWADKTHALIRDERERWKPSCVKLERLEYIKPTGMFR